MEYSPSKSRGVIVTCKESYVQTKGCLSLPDWAAGLVEVGSFAGPIEVTETEYTPKVTIELGNGGSVQIYITLNTEGSTVYVKFYLDGVDTEDDYDSSGPDADFNFPIHNCLPGSIIEIRAKKVGAELAEIKNLFVKVDEAQLTKISEL